MARQHREKRIRASRLERRLQTPSKSSITQYVFLHETPGPGNSRPWTSSVIASSPQISARDTSRRKAPQLPPQSQPGGGVFRLNPPSQAPSRASKSEYDKFLERIPKAKGEWKSKSEEVELHTPEQLTHAFECLTSSFRTDVKPTKVNDLLTTYSGCLHRLERGEPKQVYQYGMIVFLSLCVVALHRRPCSLKSVNELIQKFLEKSQGKSQPDARYLWKMRNVVKWVAQASSKLAERGFRHRGWSIFLNCTALFHDIRSITKTIYQGFRIFIPVQNFEPAK